MTAWIAKVSPRAFGPIRLYADSFPKPKGIRRVGKWIDVGDLRGSLIPITKHGAAVLLGTRSRVMDAFISAGVVDVCKRYTSANRTYVLIDPGTCLRRLYLDWVASRGMPVTHADFALHRGIRRRCQIPTSEPFPELVLEGAFQRLSEHGCFARQEINAFVSLDKVNFPAVRSWFDSRIGEHRYRKTKSAVPIGLSDFKASLPESLSTLPGSCFCPVRGLVNEGPSARIRQRLMSLRELYGSAVLYCLITAPRLRRPDLLREHVIAIERVEEVMQTFAPNRRWTAADYTKALRDYVLNGFARPQDGPAVRDITIRIWRMIAYRIRLFVRQATPELQLLLQPYVPPRYIIDQPLRAQIIRRFGDLRQEGRANRKRDTELALAELDTILAAATNRRDELRAFGDAFRRVVDHMAPDASYEDFSVTVPVLDEKGLLVGGTQQVYFRVWRIFDAWNSLLDNNASLDLKILVKRKTQNSPALISRKFVVEHVETKGVGNTEPIDPWMIQLDRLCVNHSIADAAPDLKESRHAAIVANALPVGHPMVTGVLTFGVDCASLKQHGLKDGRHFFPLEEIEYGIRLSYHMLDCVSQSFNRAQEIRQQVCRDWVQLDVESEEAWHSQDVWPKVPSHVDLAQCEKVPLSIRETSLNEAIDICELHMRRCGFSQFPVMRPAGDLRWKCPPDKYIISYNGTHLTRGECGTLFRYLLAGWPPFTLHDFRHVMAEDAALDGTHPALVAMLLSRTNIQNALHYMKLPSWARQVLRKTQLATRMDRQDAMAASSHGKAETDG